MSAQVVLDNKIDSNINDNERFNLKDYVKQTPSAALLPQDKTDIDAVKLFAYAICREYLGGIWKNIDIENFGIERASGGLTNYLYRCEIPSAYYSPLGNEPKKIFLRLYGENHKKNSSIMLKDVVVNAIMSDYAIGPKLYGVFSAGRLEELVPGHPLERSDLDLLEVNLEIAAITAQFHSLDMPFIKQPNWLFDTTAKYMNQALALKFSQENDIKLFNKILSFNLENEFNRLKQVLISIDSLVVFCHNDINLGNILKLTNKLMIIDYEYGSYNYRGFDFGNFFCEYMFNNNYEHPPYFQVKSELYPSRDQQLLFIRAYIKKFKELNEKKRSLHEDETELNSDEDKSQSNSIMYDEEHLLVEANYFALASHLFWAMWAVCQASSSKIQFGYLEYALARCDTYFYQKKVLFPNDF